MSTQNQPVYWSMPKWAADLILEAITNQFESAAFDRNTKDALRVAAKTIKRNTVIPLPAPANSGFDLFRLSKSKEVVDVCPNTLRAYNKQGLPFYHRGKSIFVSKAELAQFVMYAPVTQAEDEADP